ncbi:MAG: hypothetical protein GY807_04505 [Gammaproteobacteria bacterium]|nr:hypothetical protein [Gammaproteobacteria bacterium]
MSNKRRPGVWIAGGGMQLADKSSPPQLANPIHQSFFPKIGELIVVWSLMERKLNLLLKSLLELNGAADPKLNALGFDRKLKLCLAEWEKFSTGSDDLRKFLIPAIKDIRHAKVLRDSIAHKDLDFGLHPKGDHCIRFHNNTRAKQMSKYFYVEDFSSAIQSAQSAAGYLAWICDRESAWPLAEADAERLRTLPNTGHW